MLCLGGGQALLQPLVGLLRRLDARRERLLDVDVGQRVGPERRLLGSRCVTVTSTSRLSGTGSTPTWAMKDRRVGDVLEGPLVGELEPLHHLLAQALRAQHLELGVVEVGVLPVAPGAHQQRVGDGHERGRRRLDLQHARRPGTRASAGAPPPARRAGPPPRSATISVRAAPEQVGVVAEVDLALADERGLHGRGLALAPSEQPARHRDDVVRQERQVGLLAVAHVLEVDLDDRDLSGLRGRCAAP